MSHGIWTQGRIDNPSQGQGASDCFKRATSNTAFGTAGLSLVAAPGRFYRGIFQNGAATAYWLQIFDKASAPVANDVPIWERKLAASSELEIDLVNINGILCALGIGIAISSTADKLTLAIANDIKFYSVIYTANS